MPEQTEHMKKLEAAKITLYFIRAWVHEHKRGGELKRIEYKQAVIVDSLDWAKVKFKEFKNEIEGYAPYGRSKYSGHVELVKPHIFDNGELAYWGETLEEYVF